LILTAKGNYNKFIGYYAFYNSDYVNAVHMPPAWEPTFVLEAEVKKRFEAKHVKDPKKWFYGETGFIMP